MRACNVCVRDGRWRSCGETEILVAHVVRGVRDFSSSFSGAQCEVSGRLLQP